jgi:hypothetical protein
MESAHSKGGNRRLPGAHWRAKTMTVRFTDGERAAVRAAAERAGMAMSAWVGELAVDAAEHRAMPPGWLHREVMTELVHLRSQIVWVGNNVNQIARAINSGIVPDKDLQPLHPADGGRRQHRAGLRKSPEADVIGRVVAPGKNVAGVLYYLFGKGRRNNERGCRPGHERVCCGGCRRSGFGEDGDVLPVGEVAAGVAEGCLYRLHRVFAGPSTPSRLTDGRSRSMSPSSSRMRG